MGHRRAFIYSVLSTQFVIVIIEIIRNPLRGPYIMRNVEHFDSIAMLGTIDEIH